MPQFDINHIIFEGQGRAEIFSFRPENIEKEKRGNLFLLGKIGETLSRSEASYYLLNSIAAILKKEYYSPLHPQSLRSFEAALKKINTLLLTVQPDVMQSLEATALAVTGDQVTFSSLGGCEVLLLRGERLFRLAKPHSKEKKLFLHVTKGKIKTNDKLFVGTSDLSEWLKNSSFNSRLIKRTLDRVQEYMSQERRDRKDTRSLALLSIAINAPLGLAPLHQEEGSMQEVPHPIAQPMENVLPLPTRFTPIPSTTSSALTSLKRYYLHYWHGKQPVSQFAAALHKVTVLVKNKFPLLQKNYYLNSKPSLRSPLGIGISVLVGIALIWGVSILFSSTSSTLKTDETAGFLAQNQRTLFSFPSEFPLSYALATPQAMYVIADQKLSLVNVKENKLDSFLSLEGEIKGVASSPDSLFIVEKLSGKQWQIITVNAQARSVKKDLLTWPLDTDLVKDIRYYEGNLYMAEKFSHQIVKYKVGQFSKPALWISSKNLSQIGSPISFAIDGSVYLLQEDSMEIIQLRGGEIDHVIPLPSSIQPSYIETSTGLDRIYLFNGAKGELAMMDKESKTLIKTFSHKSLIGLKTITINEADQTLTVLNTKGIFVISIVQDNEAL